MIIDEEEAPRTAAKQSGEIPLKYAIPAIAGSGAACTFGAKALFGWEKPEKLESKEELEQKLQQFPKKIEEENKKIEDLNQRAKSEDDAIRKLNTDVAQKKEEIKQKDNDIKQCEIQIGASNAEDGNKKTQLTEKQQELVQVKAEQAQLQQQDGKVKQDRENIQKLQKECEELKGKVSAIEQIYLTPNVKLTPEQAEIKKLIVVSKEIKKLKKRIDDLSEGAMPANIERDLNSFKKIIEMPLTNKQQQLQQEQTKLQNLDLFAANASRLLKQIDQNVQNLDDCVYLECAECNNEGKPTDVSRVKIQTEEEFRVVQKIAEALRINGLATVIGGQTNVFDIRAQTLQQIKSQKKQGQNISLILVLNTSESDRAIPISYRLYYPNGYNVFHYNGKTAAGEIKPLIVANSYSAYTTYLSPCEIKFKHFEAETKVLLNEINAYTLLFPTKKSNNNTQFTPFVAKWWAHSVRFLPNMLTKFISQNVLGYPPGEMMSEKEQQEFWEQYDDITLNFYSLVDDNNFQLKCTGNFKVDNNTRAEMKKTPIKYVVVQMKLKAEKSNIKVIVGNTKLEIADQHQIGQNQGGFPLQTDTILGEYVLPIWVLVSRAGQLRRHLLRVEIKNAKEIVKDLNTYTTDRLGITIQFNSKLQTPKKADINDIKFEDIECGIWGGSTHGNWGEIQSPYIFTNQNLSSEIGYYVFFLDHTKIDDQLCQRITLNADYICRTDNQTGSIKDYPLEKAKIGFQRADNAEESANFPVPIARSEKIVEALGKQGNLAELININSFYQQYSNPANTPKLTADQSSAMNGNRAELYLDSKQNLRLVIFGNSADLANVETIKNIKQSAINNYIVWGK